MTRLEAYFASYAAYHRTRGNQLCHNVGIPLIVVSLFGMLGHLGQGHLNAAVALWAGSLLWFLTLDWKLAIPFGLVSLGLDFVGEALPLPVNVALFLVGWAFQLVGHSVYEKNRPAFLENLKQLLIGPLWIFAKLIRYP